MPILAKDYSVSDDGTTTTVTLQSGVRFHTGAPLTADDVVYSLESSRGTAYYGSRLRDVTAIEALDARTVVLTTTVAYDELPLLLDIPIIQKDTMEKDVPPGTGPYKFESTERLVRNTDWWQDSAPLVDYDEITLTSVSTTAEIRDNFEYENISMVLTDPNSAAYAGFHNDYELWEDGTCILQYIGYNIGSRVFSNYGLRSAITYAIDRDTIVSDAVPQDDLTVRHINEDRNRNAELRKNGFGLLLDLWLDAGGDICGFCGHKDRLLLLLLYHDVLQCAIR